MEERHIRYYSQILGKNMDILVHGSWGYPVLLFPTSMGHFTQNRDFGLVNAAKHLIEAGKIKIYNVASIDFESFYAEGLAPNIKIYNYHLYTRFISEELIPAIQVECSVDKIAVGGASFGGYHSANIAFKYPEKVAYLFSMSGAFSISSFMKGYFDDYVYFNNPQDYLPGRDSWIYNHMKIILGTSDWDICLADNKNMSKLLASKHIDHWYDEKKWANHDWPLWLRMFPEYLERHF